MSSRSHSFEPFRASFYPVSNAAATQTHLIIRKEEHKVGSLSSVARGQRSEREQKKHGSVHID